MPGITVIPGFLFVDQVTSRPCGASRARRADTNRSLAQTDSLHPRRHRPAPASEYDISTLAGKVALLNGTAGLPVRFSACVEHEAIGKTSVAAPAPITPTNVLTSSLDGTSVTAPAVTVNQDVSAAPQNETAIAVDPNNPERVVGSSNDYVSRTRSTRATGSEAGSSATTPICRSDSTEGSTRWGLTPTTSSQSVGSTAPSSCQRSSTNRTRSPQQASSRSR